MKDFQQAKGLCKKAEQNLSEKNFPEKSPSGDGEKLIHELRVRQIELEMQNDELRKAHAEIEASRSRYVELYDFAPVGYFTLDGNGVIEEANLMGAGLLGVDRQALAKTPFVNFVVSEDCDRFLAYRQRVFQNPGKQICEIRLRGRGNIPLWVRLESVIVAAPEKKLAWMRMAAGDITERKRAEEALREEHNILEIRVKDRTAELAQINARLQKEIEDRRKAEEELRDSEERLRKLVENAPLGILSMDSNGNIVDVNSRLISILGSPSLEATRAISMLTFPPLVESGIAGNYRRCLETGEAGIYENTYRTKWGKEVSLRQYLTPILDAEGKVHGVLAIMEDTSEQKKLENQLMQAQKVEAIGTLAGGIAHDFNNILGAIIGYAELAGFEIGENAKARYNLQQSMTAAHRAKDLVQQILTFSRRGVQERKILDIKPIIKEGLKFLRSSLPATIEIRKDLEEDLGPIEADPTQIYQVLMNLCTNAAHAMEAKGGILEVSLGNLEVDGRISAALAGVDPGPYVRLRVSDTGHGMPGEIRERIFDPYFTTKGVGKGTGLGLAVVHGIVKSCGGGIAVSSEVGKGSVFDVYFPMAEPAKSPAPASRVEPLPLGGHERVLFVDDEKAIAEIGKEVLERLGYKAEVRTGSVEALELFRADPDRFDLVITDMTMPNLTGDKLAQELIRIRPGIPIILCTGFSEHITEEKAKALGVREFVMKPLNLTELARAMRRALGARESKKR